LTISLSCKTDSMSGTIKMNILFSVLLACSCAVIVHAQEGLYTTMFPSADVRLLKGPFLHARDLNLRTLKAYDVDRLLAPYRKEAGLPPKTAGYRNWEGLDGHVGGHYLSALAMNYAATGDTACRRRIDYMLSELKTCQESNSVRHTIWGFGYIGGVPDSEKIWSLLMKGDFSLYRAAWVPWYNIHKMYAGLRDAWAYTGNADAKNIFLRFCDWGIGITSSLTDQQMQSMLDTEHGGMNEIFADAYQMTGDVKYLAAAKRFSHNMLLEPMSKGYDNLDNKHANTQVPKAVGFQRIAELDMSPEYFSAAGFFWQTVTAKRTLAFGGNSRREFFPSVSSSTDFINDVEGPESCNSYNMLRLTEGIFRTAPLARYADYYERTLYNHILSTQHPVSGGYVYFTPVRPRHYRVYSATNEAMWCCVGSGMENHGKYNAFIYTHKDDSLFINLFIASELTWKNKGIRLRQETRFPDEEQTSIRIVQGSGDFTLMIRYPGWVAARALKILINGKPVSYTAAPSSYVAVKRLWKTGDRIKVVLPMRNTIEHLPNVPAYIAIMHGPILLGARTGTEGLKGLVADASRWGHIPGGDRLPIDKAPIIVEDSQAFIVDKLEPVKNKPLTFTAPKLSLINPVSVTLEPFFRIHDTRYMVYWLSLTGRQYQVYLDSIAAAEKSMLDIQNRTVDFVSPGEQQPEADHDLQSSRSCTGNYLNAFWRDAGGGGFFSYLLSTNRENKLAMIVRYWGAEWGNRTFDIYIDDEKMITENNTGRWNQSGFKDITYDIPSSMTEGKSSIRVKFQASDNNTAGAVYHVRLVKKAG
jgi:DUF1680 family protein